MEILNYYFYEKKPNVMILRKNGSDKSSKYIFELKDIEIKFLPFKYNKMVLKLTGQNWTIMKYLETHARNYVPVEDVIKYNCCSVKVTNRLIEEIRTIGYKEGQKVNVTLSYINLYRGPNKWYCVAKLESIKECVSGT